MRKAANAFNNLEAQQIFNRFNNYWGNEIIVVQYERFVSIYDETISFESIEEKAKFISKNTDKPVLFTSNFDNDIFIFGIYQTGKRITRGKIGDGLSIYGLTQEKINIEKFINTLLINKIKPSELINFSGEIGFVKKKLKSYYRSH